MPRKPRVEYAGAIYHVMNRGDRKNLIYRDDRDKGIFLGALKEVCLRTGWLIHAYVLLDNHYHFLLETPEPNLVSGMKWLQGTYTQRFNCRYAEYGHLFQGRYKALLVDGESGDYFSTVASYIHMNPVRAGLILGGRPDLMSYCWSSYPAYIDLDRRDSWLRTDRVLGALGIADDRRGRKQFLEYMQRRVVEWIGGEASVDAEKTRQSICRGWCYGDEEFRERMEQLVDRRVEEYDRRSYSGHQVTSHDERMAERILDQCLRAFGIIPEDLAVMAKGDSRKKVMAWAIRRRTCVRNDWIANRLCMGRGSNLSRHMREVESASGNGVADLREMIKNEV